MLNQKETLDILNKEKDYEDKLVEKISSYFISCLEDIEGLTSDQVDFLYERLNIIMNDSRRHSDMFNICTQKVVEGGPGDY